MKNHYTAVFSENRDCHRSGNYFLISGKYISLTSTIIIDNESINKITFSIINAGKAILLQFIVISPQPPIRVMGINSETILDKKIPIIKPILVLGSVKMKKQKPMAEIKNPIPISACDVQ